MSNKRRKEKHRLYNKKREAKIEANGGLRHTNGEWNMLCKLAEYKCLCCKKGMKQNGNGNHLTRDHVVPLCKGGTDHISNIQPLCKLCNSLKNDMEIDYRSENLKTLVNLFWN